MKKNNRKLRIGILVDDDFIPNWSYKMIEEIKSRSNSELILVLNISENVLPVAQKLVEKFKIILFNCYVLLDKKININRPEALKRLDLKALLQVNSTFITIDLNGGKIANHVLNGIKKYEIDILLNIRNKQGLDDLSEISRYGMWSIQASNSDGNQGDIAGFMEVFQGKAETEIRLMASLETCKEQVLLHKTSYSTDLLSLKRNQNLFYWKASSIIITQIEEIINSGELLFYEKIKRLDDYPSFKYKKVWQIPSNWQILIDAPLLLFFKLKNKFELSFNFYQWILLFKIGKTEDISTNLSKFQKIIPPHDRFWADPHPLKRENTYYIFFEELIYKENKGYICLIEMDENGNYSEPVKVLEKDYHLSYPYLIEENNELFMLPESKQNKTLELYKCTQFPLKWELEKVLMKNIKAVDASILHQDNKYWLFCNVTKSDGTFAEDELHLFYSDKLISDNWTEHPKNPIVCDFKRSRPAGKIFKYKDKIYRPAQNGLKGYGYGMVIHEIIALNEENYEEKIVDSILPEWEKDLIGTHTLNWVGGLTIIDALIKRRKKSRYF
jgi:hypothetical protein